MYNDISKKATMKYIAQKRDEFKINLPKGEKQKWKAQAESKGFKSLSAYIKHLVAEDE